MQTHDLIPFYIVAGIAMILLVIPAIDLEQPTAERIGHAVKKPQAEPVYRVPEGPDYTTVARSRYTPTKQRAVPPPTEMPIAPQPRKTPAFEIGEIYNRLQITQFPTVFDINYVESGAPTLCAKAPVDLTKPINWVDAKDPTYTNKVIILCIHPQTKHPIISYRVDDVAQAMDIA